MLSISRRAVVALTSSCALVLALAAPAGVIAAIQQGISSDPFTQSTCKASNTTNHHTEVEPDTFSNGSTIVAAFQVGRIYDGGACAPGFATPTNTAPRCTCALPPATTGWPGGGHTPPPPPPSSPSPPRHNVWLISSLTL